MLSLIIARLATLLTSCLKLQKMASTVLQCTSGMAYQCLNKTDITLELFSALQNHFLFVYCSIDTGKSIRQTDDSTHSHI